MPLAATLSRHVDSDVRLRGFEYYRADRVKIETVSRTAVSATVQGAKDYDVDLRLEGRTVYATCCCTFVEKNWIPCKHIWATVLAAESQGFGRSATGQLRLSLDDDFKGDDDGFDDDFEEPPKWACRPPGLRHSKAGSWKTQLTALHNDLAGAANSHAKVPPAEQQLVFVIDAAASEAARKLVLECAVCERKKNGEWGKPQSRHLSGSQIDLLTSTLDRDILEFVAGARPDNGYLDPSSYYGSGALRYRITGRILDTVLPLLAETGRVRLRRDPSQPTVLEELLPDLDPPWKLVVRVNPSKEKKEWILGGSLLRGDQTLSLSHPALLVPGLIVWDGRFGRFDDAGSYAWVPTLRRVGTIAVPAKATDELLGQLLQMPRLPQLELPEELRHTEVATPPRPRLVVKAPTNYYGQQSLLLELSFLYDGETIAADSPVRGVFRPGERQFLVRDPAAELAARQELARHGARLGWHSGAQRLELKPAQLPKLVHDLVPAGWMVEAEGKVYRTAGSLELAVSTGLDWFDLNGAANFEGKSVPFPRLLEALRRGEGTVVLDDGSLGLLPDDWLKRYGLVAKMGAVEGDAIRFSKTQIGLLDALLASRPEVTFDTQFDRARGELRKFEGIAAKDSPQVFRGELREYQRVGLGWLHFLRQFGFGGCLADDMGLGKTVQVLALLAAKRGGPALVVVPRSLVFNWKQEAARFTPSLKVLDHTGAARDRTGAQFQDFDIVLTTYGTLRNDAVMFAKCHFDSCILDESQAAKNANTETAKAVRVVQADHRLALSGTPVENHLGELWTLFDFLNPGMLGKAMLTGGGAGSLRNPDVETRDLLARALRPFILRRTKDQVAKDLPEKTEQTVYCDLEPAQRQMYDELREHYRQSLLARVDSVGLARSKIQVLEALLRLRQAACHPGLIDKARVAEPSAKLDVLLPQLQELAESGHKALVFSQFTSLLAIVRSRLHAAKLSYEYLDGHTRDRQARVERFQTDADCRLFLVSLKAGGVGLNLTAAEYVFLLDPWWNPAVEAQAIDRTHRIGQTRPVFAYRLIARDTVEEKVLALQQSKRALADAILGGDGRLITDLKREDLELLLS